MLTRLCNGCGYVIADDDTTAARDVYGDPAARPMDWCGSCLAVIRRELPRLVREARRARLETSGPIVRSTPRQTIGSRALRLWDKTEVHPRTGA